MTDYKNFVWFSDQIAVILVDLFFIYSYIHSEQFLFFCRSLLKFLSKAQADEPLPAMLKFLAEPSTIPDQLKTARAFNFDLYKMAYKYNSLL